MTHHAKRPAIRLGKQRPKEKKISSVAVTMLWFNRGQVARIILGSILHKFYLLCVTFTASLSVERAIQIFFL